MIRPIVIATVVLLLNSGCMHLRVVAFDDTSHPEPVKVRRSSYFWGLKQPVGITTSERCKSICRVETSTNMGDIIVSFVTLGIVVPQTLIYDCCPFEPVPVDE